jgi:hypothetical protein
MTPVQALKLHQRIMLLLKARFPNLTVEETGKLAGDIVLLVHTEYTDV